MPVEGWLHVLVKSVLVIGIARLCRNFRSKPEALACFFVYLPVIRNVEVVSLGIFVYQAAAPLF